MNEAQLAAVTTRVPDVLVSAGAGSGKTMVLTQRYFHLITNHRYKVDQILTLTFTRKAAQEMRERIARDLECAGLTKERRALSRAPIGTIHSYCERLLREHALEAGIDPNFRLLDQVEANTLEEKTLDAIFADIWDGDQQEREEIGRLLLDIPHHELRAALRDLHGAARTHGIPIAGITPEDPTSPAECQREVLTALEALLALKQEGTATWQLNVEAAEVAAADLWEVLSAAEWSWESLDQVSGLQARLTPSGGPKDRAKAAREGIKAALERWCGAVLDQLVLPYQRAFLILLTRFDQQFTAAKQRTGLLDMADLLLLTDALLARETTGAPGQSRPQFRQVMVDEFQDTNPLQARIIQRLRGDGHLFLVGDVKQSIYRFIGSDVQVFLRHQEEITALGVAGQRIGMHHNYRTRPEVLEPLNSLFAGLWPAADAAAPDTFFFEPLTAGQQFAATDTPAIEIAFWSGDAYLADEAREHEAAWVARRMLQLTGKLGNAPLHLTEKRENPEDPITTRPASFRDILLLFRASTDIPRHEYALRQAGIPYYVVSGRGFYQTPEVQDLLRLLQVVENPLDDFALAVVLRSPLVGVSDDTLYWLSRDWSTWRPGTAFPEEASASRYGRLWPTIAQAETVPILPEDDRAALRAFRALLGELQALLPAGQPLDLLDLILARTRYLACLLAADGGEQRAANVRKLREVAADFQQRDIFDMADFQRYLSQLGQIATREASAPLDVEASDVVRLMTIHAAKGLEAPIVFLADCGREAKRDYPVFHLTPRGRLLCKAPTPEGEWQRPAAYAVALEAAAAEDQAEGERLLYVALTRAREHLICSGFTKFSGKDTYADLLAALLGLTGAVSDDTVLTRRAGAVDYPIFVWSPTSLAAIEALTPPPQPPTLWEQAASRLLAGVSLPISFTQQERERLERVIDRFAPLDLTRRAAPLRVGVNRALCYDTCPRQYWYRHVLLRDRLTDHSTLTGVTADEEMPDEAQERLDGTAFGTLLHAVMQRIDFNAPLPAQAPEILTALAQQRDMSTSAADHVQLAHCLTTFMSSPLYAAVQRADTVYRELPFLVQDGAYYMPGIIDVLLHDADGWWILDYKTGQPSARHLRQLYLYALGVERTLGERPTRLALAYVEQTGAAAVRQEPVLPTLLDDARRVLQQAGDGIRAQHYAPKPGRVCEFCAYNGGCPNAAVGG